MTNLPTIDLSDLETTCGGARLDQTTEQALTRLLEQTKDLARQPTNSSQQLTNLMFVAVASRVMRG